MEKKRKKQSTGRVTSYNKIDSIHESEMIWVL